VFPGILDFHLCTICREITFLMNHRDIYIYVYIYIYIYIGISGYIIGRIAVTGGQSQSVVSGPTRMCVDEIIIQ
jgi:hypothetical protein